MNNMGGKVIAPRQAGRSPRGVGISPLLRDRRIFLIAPLDPRPLVFAHIWITQQLRQHEPCVGGEAAAHAVGDDGPLRPDAQAAAAEPPAAVPG